MERAPLPSLTPLVPRRERGHFSNGACINMRPSQRAATEFLSCPVSRLICAAPFDNCLGAVAGRKLVINVAQMEMHGRKAKPKLVGDFLVKKAFRQQSHHCILAD